MWKNKGRQPDCLRGGRGPEGFIQALMTGLERCLKEARCRNGRMWAGSPGFARVTSSRLAGLQPGDLHLGSKRAMAVGGRVGRNGAEGVFHLSQGFRTSVLGRSET